MLLVHQYNPIPRLALLHIDNRAIRLLHGIVVVPRPHLLRRKQVQHVADLLGAADATARDLDLLAQQRERAEGRDVVLGRADLAESAVDAQQLAVPRQRHLRRRHGADDQVERLPVLAVPVLVLVCGDEVVGAHLERIGLFRRRAADDDQFVHVQCLGAHDAEVAQAAEPDDPDSFAGSCAVLCQW